MITDQLSNWVWLHTHRYAPSTLTYLSFPKEVPSRWLNTPIQTLLITASSNHSTLLTNPTTKPQPPPFCTL